MSGMEIGSDPYKFDGDWDGLPDTSPTNPYAELRRRMAADTFGIDEHHRVDVPLPPRPQPETKPTPSESGGDNVLPFPKRPQ